MFRTFAAIVVCLLLLGACWLMLLDNWHSALIFSTWCVVVMLMSVETALSELIRNSKGKPEENHANIRTN